MLQRRGSAFIGGNGYWKLIEEVFLDTGPSSARTSARALGTEKEGKLRGDYSTVNSAQRVSATLSIRPRGRVQIIDM